MSIKRVLVRSDCRCIGISAVVSALFLRERKQVIEEIFGSEGEVAVTSFAGLTVDLAKKLGRDGSSRPARGDFSCEMPMAIANRRLG